MSMFFSATTLWFYSETDKAKYEAGIGWPSDAVRISDDDWICYAQPAPDGFMLGADESGKPSWLNMPAPTAEEITAIADARKAQLRADADAIIAPLQDAVSLNIATEEEAARYDSWRQYRVMLSRIDTSQALTIEWPERPA